MSSASDLALIQGVVEEALSVLSELPGDFEPPGPGDVPAPPPGADVETLLQDPDTRAMLKRAMEGWPSGVFPAFLHASDYLGQMLERYGWEQGDSDLDVSELLAQAVGDPETQKLMLAAAQIVERGDAEGDEKGSLGLRRTLVEELLRRNTAQKTPFARTLSTLLGPDAPKWLGASSEDGVVKLQPHELSRTRWVDLQLMEAQIAIENELLHFGKLDEETAKIVVALCWTMVALATRIEPEVFLAERLPHLSSLGDERLTISQGVSTHTIVVFEPKSMLPVLEVLGPALAEPSITARDLMWMASGVARIRRFEGEAAAAEEPRRERFRLFLSHRGRDAKRVLADNVLARKDRHGIFLDCLALPRGVVNRNHVFGSLAQSERIVIVDTPHFHESDWCKKELWLAEILSRLGRAEVSRLSLPDATTAVESLSVEARASRKGASPECHYPIVDRVLRDLDYWAREPNVHGLREKGVSTERFEPLESLLGDEGPSRTDGYWDDPAHVAGLGERVTSLLRDVVEETPDGEPIDLWSTALQYVVAAFGATSSARSKVDVRGGVDQLNALLGRLVEEGVPKDVSFQERPAEYLALVGAAVAIDLSGFSLDPRMEPAVARTIGGAGVLRDGLLLLDVRRPGRLRDLNLRLLVAAVRSNFGSIGIVQRAEDPVYELEYDGMSLEILPCVTLHPGMEAWFGEPGGAPGR